MPVRSSTTGSEDLTSDPSDPLYARFKGIPLIPIAPSIPRFVPLPRVLVHPGVL
jgi:hypothetical protein